MLPDKLSDLLDVAIADLRKVEGDNRYSINMSFWHRQMDGGCSVCLAGAVLAKTVGVPIDEYMSPSYACNIPEPRLAEKLYAINAVRTGLVALALRHLRVKHNYDESLDKHVPPYGAPGFFEALDLIALTLRKKGL